MFCVGCVGSYIPLRSWLLHISHVMWQGGWIYLEPESTIVGKDVEVQVGLKVGKGLGQSS